MPHIDIVFDGPPGHEAGRFVEVENEQGASIRFGEWMRRDDGYWVIRILPHDMPGWVKCARCGEPIASDTQPDGCRDPDCPAA